MARARCWDSRGRMWIAENRDYETRGRGFSNSGDSRILILEDTQLDLTLEVRFCNREERRGTYEFKLLVGEDEIVGGSTFRSIYF